MRVLRNADTALYKAKREGRNHYQVYGENMSLQVSELLTLENLLAQVIAKKELQLYYQPRINIKTNQITAMEVSIKWQHPERGLIPLAEFLPSLEETEQIIPLGDWLIENACLQQKTWQDSGLPVIPVTIHLSSRQFHQADLVLKITNILNSAQLKGDLLELEISEKNILEKTDVSIAVLNQLRELGIRISVDDFGASYRFIKYLGKSLIQTLKLEQDLVEEVYNNPQDSGVIPAMITLGNSFQINVVAEGVNQPEHLEILSKLNCEEMQGYLFSQPLSIIEATDLLTNGLTFSQQ
jgi:EAL domain-containing protein (putative c-di-GMP-specific phosphodiesterase class I)